MLRTLNTNFLVYPLPTCVVAVGYHIAVAFYETHRQIAVVVINGIKLSHAVFYYPDYIAVFKYSVLSV